MSHTPAVEDVESAISNAEFRRLLAVLLALYGDWIRRWRIHPILDLDTRVRRPDADMNQLVNQVLTRQKNSWVSSGSGSLPSE